MRRTTPKVSAHQLLNSLESATTLEQQLAALDRLKDAWAEVPRTLRRIVLEHEARIVAEVAERGEVRARGQVFSVADGRLVRRLPT